MRVIFIDSLYLIGLLVPDDQWHEACQRARASLVGAVRLVTTYEVLTETLAGVSRGNPQVRAEAVATVRDITSDSIITLVPPSSNLFERGLELYASRPDKRYSLTDCISMTVMRDLDITEILTHDRDFENEGFTRLIK